MSKKDVYRFWAAFHYAPEGVSVRFSDLPGCLTCGDNADLALVAAREALGGYLVGMENDGDEIPDPSSLTEVLAQLEDNEAACDVQVYMPTIREAMDSKSVKKTLTVPKWLNDEAEKHGVNFSQILQKGLKEALGITR
jgi:predicted RNase H-like HicB family nuclease